MNKRSPLPEWDTRKLELEMRRLIRMYHDSEPKSRQAKARLDNRVEKLRAELKSRSTIVNG